MILDYLKQNYSVMAKVLILLFIIAVISCKQNPADNKIAWKTKTSRHSKVVSKRKLETKGPDTILSITKGFVDGRHFDVERTIQGNVFVVNGKKDTIFRDSNFTRGIIFQDFDRDGYKDIKLEYTTNVPGIEDLLLYDKTEKKFKKVIGFDDFPSSLKINGTKYYYSYHRNGCADMNWTSDLFCIENYKAVKLGTINGNECGDSGIKDGIYIYKIVGGKEIEIKQLSIKTIYSYKDYKWGFIKSYWYKNYRLFK
ncbi:hypothetical protein ABIB62_003148 [Mucilaginibacter sp. UYP25]|uniref:hypothetical protein n=1 Tax=unclassified Mucilaginibacter TaxID=2617802 RepID=UPI0033990BCD